MALEVEALDRIVRSGEEVLEPGYLAWAFCNTVFRNDFRDLVDEYLLRLSRRDLAVLLAKAAVESHLDSSEEKVRLFKAYFDWLDHDDRRHMLTVVREHVKGHALENQVTTSVARLVFECMAV